MSSASEPLLLPPVPPAMERTTKTATATIAATTSSMKKKPKTIGSKKFTLAKGKKSKLTVRLSKAAKKAISKAGKRGLKTSVSGTGVKAKKLTLKAAKRRKR